MGRRAGAQAFKHLFGGAAWRNQDLPNEDGNGMIQDQKKVWFLVIYLTNSL
jgi:hypothetical protein